MSKSCADLIAQAYAATYDLPVSVTRCGNLFGGGDLNFNRLVPGTIRDVLAGRRPVLRSDGTPLRDYIYVEDIVEAYVRLAERTDDAGIRGQAWNYALSSPVSALTLARVVTRLCGRPDLEPEIRATAHHEIPEQHLAADKAAAMLGWAPTFGLEAGLERTVAWYRTYLGTADALDPAA